MADKAHRLTDEKLEEMEKRLSAIYSRAEKEIQKTADEYFSKFAAQDEKKRKLLEQGKITEDEYKKWRKGKVMYGKRFTEMKEQCAKQLLNVNQTALAYVNGELPEVYAFNYNALAGSVDGVDGYSPVTVNVPIPDGYIQPSGSITIAENGTYDVTEKASAVVSIPEREIVLQDKTIKASGTYSADAGYDGLGQVTVNVAGSTNTESEGVAALLANTMTVLDNSLVTTLRTRVCQAATNLITVNLPNVTSLGAYAFYQCSNLKTVTLPKLTTISTQTWYMCPKLEYADCGQLGSITAQTFASCTALKALILRKTSSICTLSNANGVNGSGIGKGTGYVYVPASLIETYKTATNWSAFANQFRAIEDYPEICGGLI